MEPKIGVTEQGDAALDLSWVDKLNTVKGAVVITKGLYEPFKQQLLTHKIKLILHLTCTGYGGTALEPHVPTLSQTLASLDDLIHRGFPVEQIVARVDPIIPTEKGIARAIKVSESVYRLGIRRIRVSVLDMYPHVRLRFQQAGLPLPYGNNWQASTEQFKALDRQLLLMLCRNPGISLESCAEPMLKVPKRIGCISEAECEFFGIKMTDDPHKQRPACLCCGEKTELLTNRHPCAHGCLYCYWKE